MTDTAHVEETTAFFVLCRECELARRWSRDRSPLFDFHKDAEAFRKAHDEAYHQEPSDSSDGVGERLRAADAG